MTDDAFPLPELTRGLRVFGSGRARPGSDHDRYFAPLVAPLRELRAQHARAIALGADGAPWSAVEAVDGARAADELRTAIATLAAERFPTAAPDRRALEAELLDEADELFLALDALAAAAVRLRDAVTDRAAAWREWSTAFASAFNAADRSWARSLAALDQPPIEPKRPWGSARRKP